MTTAVAEETREVVRCPHCKLNQFMTANKNCRRCKQGLILPPPVVVKPEPRLPDGRRVFRSIAPVEGAGRNGIRLDLAIQVMRAVKGWSQRDLADAAGMERTYISKLELQYAKPRIEQVERVAAAFGVSTQFLLDLACTEVQLSEDVR